MSRPSVLTPQQEELLETCKQLTAEEQQFFLSCIEQVAHSEDETQTPDVSSVVALAGTFTRQERLQLELESLSRHFQRRRQLLAGSLSAPQVAKLLGTSRQTPHDRVSSQTLLAIKDNGKLRFPLWQFDPTGADGVVEGLPNVLKALPFSDYSKLSWLTRPNPYLDGQTPIAELKQGKAERVLAVATSAGASQWS